MTFNLACLATSKRGSCEHGRGWAGLAGAPRRDAVLWQVIAGVSASLFFLPFEIRRFFPFAADIRC